MGLQPSAQHCSHPTMQPRGVQSSPLGPLMSPISALSQATMQPREEGLSFWKGHCLQIYLMQLLQEILFQHLCSCAGLQVLHSAQGSLLGIVQLIVQTQQMITSHTNVMSALVLVVQSRCLIIQKQLSAAQWSTRIWPTFQEQA